LKKLLYNISPTYAARGAVIFTEKITTIQDYWFFKGMFLRIIWTSPRLSNPSSTDVA
jgi:hypothetical protein